MYMITPNNIKAAHCRAWLAAHPPKCNFSHNPTIRLREVELDSQTVFGVWGLKLPACPHSQRFVTALCIPSRKRFNWI